MTLNRIRYPWKRRKSPSKWERFKSDPAEPSICSGVIVELENFRQFKPALTHYLEHALSVWRNFLMDTASRKESYGFHLLFIDFLESVDGRDLPDGFHWYNLRSIDASIFANTQEVYAYAKLPSMVFFAGINPRRPSKWKNTRIYEKGQFSTSNQEVTHPVFVEFYLDRMEQTQSLTDKTSAKQREKILASIASKPERSLKSHSFKVYLAEQYWKNR